MQEELDKYELAVADQGAKLSENKWSEKHTFYETLIFVVLIYELWLCWIQNYEMTLHLYRQH